MTEILSFLAARRGVDFRDYRQETIERRLRARLAATGALGWDDYGRRLAADPAETDRLLEALVVRVTSFFRNPAMFEALEARAVPAILGRLGPRRTLRAWVVGTASGEEAYSLAMLLARALEAAPGRDFEVLATDIDPAALETARRGRYLSTAALAVPAPLRDRFLEPDTGAAASAGAWVRVVPGLRERVRFARHDLLGLRLAPSEAVVAEFDIILCRNVLIYFTRPLQERAFERFAGALSAGGILVLGGAESLPGSARERFAVIDAGARIYRRTDGGGA